MNILKSHPWEQLWGKTVWEKEKCRSPATHPGANTPGPLNFLQGLFPTPLCLRKPKGVSREMTPDWRWGWGCCSSPSAAQTLETGNWVPQSERYSPVFWGQRAPPPSVIDPKPLFSWVHSAPWGTLLSYFQPIQQVIKSVQILCKFATNKDLRTI